MDKTGLKLIRTPVRQAERKSGYPMDRPTTPQLARQLWNQEQERKKKKDG